MNDRKGSENAMAEGKEYISCPDQLGSIHISEDVLAVTMANQELVHTPYEVTGEMIYQAIQELEEYRG